jgi:hypothetical protein
MCHWRLSSLFITSTSTIAIVSPPCDCLSPAQSNLELTIHPHRQQGGHFRPFSINVVLHDKERPGGSTKQGKVKGVALVDSPMRVAPLMSAKDPPPYGAQHRQDALWEGE